MWPSPRGSPPVARRRPARWRQHYKVTANTFLLLPVLSHDILTSDARGEQTRVCCQFIHQMWFTPVDLSAYVCVSVFLRPWGTPNYLMPPREFDAKMCAVKWDSAGECVLYFTWFSSERAAPDDKANTTSLSLVRVRWKVCHTSSMVSDIRKCLITVGALSSSHSTSVCWHKQQRKSCVSL